MNVLRSYFQLTRVSAVLIYAAVIVAAVSLADWKLRTPVEAAPIGPTAPVAETTENKPYFALYSNRTFGTTENPRMWIDYRGVNTLDFRVYRVNDPPKFFAQLSDPHQLGEAEQEQIATNLQKSPSVLEKISAVKKWVYSGIKTYFRSQLSHHARATLNQKFRSSEAKRTPLNVADYARVPLLNPNQLVTSWREPLAALEDQYDRRMVPLGKREPGVYLVEAVNEGLRAYTIVVVTDLAMVEKSSPNGELMVYAVDRRTGEPRANAQVEVLKAQKTVAAGRTNGDGVFRADIKKPANNEEEPAEPDVAGVDNGYLILASQRDNFAISDLYSFYFQDAEEHDNLFGYIYTDRPIYRPAQQVFFKGILRGVNEQGGYRALKSQTVHVTVANPKGENILEQDLKLSQRGTFNGELTLPEEAPLGVYDINVESEEGSTSDNFEVAEYKKPEYKVTVTTPQKFAPAGSKTKFEINARYFFGAPVTGADVEYYVYRTRYYPSYWETDQEEEKEDDAEDESDYGGGYYNEMVTQGEGKLDASGRLEVEFDVPATEENDYWDYEYSLDATVTDQSRRAISGRAEVIATRGNVMVRAETDKYVYHDGQSADITISTSDYEGKPVPAKVTLKFVQRTWERVEKKENEYDSDYRMREVELGSADVTTNREGVAHYAYAAAKPGSIVIKTVVHEGDRDTTSLAGFIWVTTKEFQWTDSAYYMENAGSIKLVPDKKSYRVGDTAHVLAILPKEDARLLVSTELESVLKIWTVNASGRTAILDVPIDANYTRNVFLNVTFVQNGDMYTNDQRLTVPARDKLLNLEIIPNKEEYRPRDTASYTVVARDADGAPVPNAEVSVGVVDEAIYSMQSEFAGNIRSAFYGPVDYNRVQTHFSINYAFRGFAGEKPVNLASTKQAYQLADFKNEGEPVEPVVRKDFKDTAFWQPNAITGSDGRATVKFRLPDNLTTWRATARAVTSDTKVGVARSKVVARKDVILRLETPRFLTQGDTVTLSGIVHNYLKQAKSTQISLSVKGAQLISPAQQTVTIDKQGDHRIDWQVAAAQTGQITLLAKALTNTESDAVELTLDVVPRGLHETKAERWTTMDDNAEQQFTLEIPGNADLNSRKLRVEVAPSIAGTLFGALDYLTTYPYGCTEQTMSSFLPNIIVSQTLKDFKTASIRTGNDLKTKVERGRNRLYGFQHDDGGWGWWVDDNSDPFMTAYVIDGLTLAEHAGYEIDDARVARGRERLQAMLDASNKIDVDTRAFMIYALAESGGVDSWRVDKLYAERGQMQPYGRALLALTLSLQKMNGRAQEVADEIERTAKTDKETAHWETKRVARLDFTEEDETEGTALSLKALSRIKPNSSLLPSVARWLVSDRKNGYYWDSTKDTAFAIFGLIDYLKVSHELKPSYDLEVYVNDETVVAERVNEASATRSFAINRKGTAVGATNYVRIVKRGKGSLYFSTAVEYYTNDNETAARESSELSVTREYYRMKVEPNGNNLKWELEPLTGEIHSGDVLVVKLHLTGKPARHLMLEDPIPAGAEQVETIGTLNLTYSDVTWSDWFSSREFRDRRTVFFLDSFDGDVTFKYAFRVQVPGDFVVAPARAELMYTPETNTNTSNGRFSFQDRSTKN